MTVAILAVLKAVAAFLPLDPEHPLDRLRHMVRDAGVRSLVTSPELIDSGLVERVLSGIDGRVLNVATVDGPDPDGPDPDGPDPDGPDLDDADSAWEPAQEVDPQDAAYIIYTSGSTGKPKGVVVPHRAVVNHADGIIETYGLDPADRVLQFAAFSFDVAVEEMLPTWLAGAGRGTADRRGRFELRCAAPIRRAPRDHRAQPPGGLLVDLGGRAGVASRRCLTVVPATRGHRERAGLVGSARAVVRAGGAGGRLAQRLRPDRGDHHGDGPRPGRRVAPIGGRSCPLAGRWPTWWSAYTTNSVPSSRSGRRASCRIRRARCRHRVPRSTGTDRRPVRRRSRCPRRPASTGPGIGPGGCPTARSNSWDATTIRSRSAGSGSSSARWRPDSRPSKRSGGRPFSSVRTSEATACSTPTSPSTTTGVEVEVDALRADLADRLPPYMIPATLPSSTSCRSRPTEDQSRRSVDHADPTGPHRAPIAGNGAGKRVGPDLDTCAGPGRSGGRRGLLRPRWQLAYRDSASSPQSSR